MRLYPGIFRQGDVCLVQVARLPADCELVPGQERKIVLAWGEVTGHHHRIEDHLKGPTLPGTQAKARLWRDRQGNRFLEVEDPVTLRHEEHAAHTLPPGVYGLPRQVEYNTPVDLRRVAD